MKFLKILTFILSFIGGALIGYSLVADLNITYLIIGIVLVVAGIGWSIIDGVVIKHKNIKKNRTTLYVPFDCDKAIIENIIQQNLTEKNYKLIKYGEEPAYKLGDGFFAARKLFKYELSDNKATIECWISVGLGNNPNTELPINDKFVGSLPKKQLKTFVTNIITQIENTKKLTSQTNQQTENNNTKTID